jgi:LmeA-like phospholipid-binding
MTELKSELETPKKSGVITKLLNQAVKFWLRTQVTEISHLEVEIRASDRQLLSGCIPWVSIVASHSVYQGIHLTQIELFAKKIRINVGAILKGQPLRLLEIIPVTGELHLEESDLSASLSSPLLSTALNDVLVQLLPEHCTNSKSIVWYKATLDNNQVLLTCKPNNTSDSLELSAALKLLSSNELILENITVKNSQGRIIISQSQSYLPLGTDVDIQELSLSQGKLVFRGTINVNP